MQINASPGTDLNQLAASMKAEIRRALLPRRRGRLALHGLSISLIRPVFEPRDIWIGLYIGPTKRSGLLRYRYLYFCPIPMLALRLYAAWLDY